MFNRTVIIVLLVALFAGLGLLAWGWEHPAQHGFVLSERRPLAELADIEAVTGLDELINGRRRVAGPTERHVGHVRQATEALVALDPVMVQRQSCAPHPRGQHGIVLHACRGIVEQFRGFVGGRQIQPGRRIPHVAGQVGAGLRQPVLQQCHVLKQRLGSRAIVALHEFDDQRLVVLRRVPHHVGDEPRPQFGEVADRTAGVPLFEQADALMIHEVADVRAEHAPVGMRDDVVGEVGDVIPDVQLWCNRAPALDVLAEGLVLVAALQRLGGGRFDRA